MLRTAMIVMLLLLSTTVPLIAAEDEKAMTITVERVEEFRAKTAGGKADVKAEDKETSSLMVIALLKGESLPGAVRMGELTFKAVDDKGAELAQRTKFFAKEDFTPVDRSGRDLEAALPADVIRIEMMMAAPSRQATKLTKLQGSVKLLVGLPVEVIVDAPADKLNKEIEDPALKAAGIKVMLMSFNPKGGAGLGVYARLRVIGKEWAIVRMEAIDPDGKVRSNGGGGGAGVGVVPSITYEIYGEAPLPEGSKLRLTVLKDMKQITVPIELKDVELP